MDQLVLEGEQVQRPKRKLQLQCFSYSSCCFVFFRYPSMNCYYFRLPNLCFMTSWLIKEDEILKMYFIFFSLLFSKREFCEKCCSTGLTTKFFEQTNSFSGHIFDFFSNFNVKALGYSLLQNKMFDFSCSHYDSIPPQQKVCFTFLSTRPIHILFYVF